MNALQNLYVKFEIERLLKRSDNSLDSQFRAMLKLVYKQLEYLEEFAKTTISTSLDRSIYDEGNNVKHIINEIASKFKGLGQFSIEEVESLKQRIHSFIPRLRIEEQKYSDGSYNLIPGEEEEEDGGGDALSLSSNMIGVSDVYPELKDKLMSSQVTAVVGMPGIGKTSLAKKLFHDPTIVEVFDQRVWVRVGKNGRVKDIPRLILAEIDPEGLQTLPEDDEKAVHEYLKECLKSKRYLVVLDDVWDMFAMLLLHPISRGLDHPFLHEESRSRILLTSRMQQRNESRQPFAGDEFTVTMRLLNKKESWDLLCNKVFCRGSSCPPQFEKAGKTISENCDGLPLMILTVARQLSKDEARTPEYWNSVAAKKNHPIFMEAYNKISKVLLPSYTYLPRLLQFCFFFIGLFRRNNEISRTKIINLWMADGFFELNVNIKLVEDAVMCLEELVINSVVMVYKKSTLTSFAHTIKTCGLHSTFLYLSRQKAREAKFSLVISSPKDSLGDGIEGHHRLSFTSNALFGIKDVVKSVEDNCAPTTRSLLCFGPYHQYQVPLCYRMELLRELDALSIRFYEFPVEVVQLVRLRYLALTMNGMIPPSISKLSSLQFLIVDRHENIKSFRNHSYLPREIWSLQGLRHLQVMGSDLPDPCGASLSSLLKLLDVSARSCTEAVFKGLPLLDELKVRIELEPDHDDGKPFSCFTHISCLQHLISLKCVIVNPTVVPPVVPFSSFPTSYLTNLSLSGLGYPWNEMRKIASLPHLRVLKLKKYAFQGPEWAVEETGFKMLLSLLIEDTDLMNWQIGCGAFKFLESLVIKSCYKLEKICGEFESRYVNNIELVDCNPLCVEEIKKAIKKKSHRIYHVHSSWVDGELKK